MDPCVRTDLAFVFRSPFRPRLRRHDVATGLGGGRRSGGGRKKGVSGEVFLPKGPGEKAPVTALSLSLREGCSIEEIPHRGASDTNPPYRESDAGLSAVGVID